MDHWIGLIGAIVMVGIAWIFSNQRRLVPWQTIFVGLALQFALAWGILKTSVGRQIFAVANDGVQQILGFSDEGARFVFGEHFADHFFAFKVLPSTIVVSSLSAVLFYLGIMPRIVRFLAKIMQKTMRVSGSESLAMAANIFLGQTEAPLCIKPYLKVMTRSEIMCMMTGGMATVAGGVLAAYVGMGIPAGHLLAASLMAAPAGLLIAKVMYPETEAVTTDVAAKDDFGKQGYNLFDAACRGASDGLMLAIQVAGMLIAFIALVAIVNAGLGKIGEWIHFPLSLQSILGAVFAPFAWLMGIPASEMHAAGALLGERMVVNEFVAYLHLAEQMKAHQLSERTAEILTYALCGFANFASVAIQIGGIGTLEPSRSEDFANLAFRSMIAGTLATFQTACIASLLI